MWQDRHEALNFFFKDLIQDDSKFFWSCSTTPLEQGTHMMEGCCTPKLQHWVASWIYPVFLLPMFSSVSPQKWCMEIEPFILGLICRCNASLSKCHVKPSIQVNAGFSRRKATAGQLAPREAARLQQGPCPRHRARASRSWTLLTRNHQNI